MHHTKFLYCVIFDFVFQILYLILNSHDSVPLIVQLCTNIYFLIEIKLTIEWFWMASQFILNFTFVRQINLWFAKAMLINGNSLPNPPKNIHPRQHHRKCPALDYVYFLQYTYFVYNLTSRTFYKSVFLFSANFSIARRRSVWHFLQKLAYQVSCTAVHSYIYTVLYMGPINTKGQSHQIMCID